MKQKNGLFTVEFQTTNTTNDGFDALCSTQTDFKYIGNNHYEITPFQKNALDILAIPYKVISPV